MGRRERKVSSKGRKLRRELNLISLNRLIEEGLPDSLSFYGVVGWRKEGLVYKKNEVFLDIVESVNLLMSSKDVKGSVLRCDVTGKILMTCFLSRMLDLKLGLNDKIGLEKESQIKSHPTKR
ncbi:AP-2 complex subunit mu [Camellia lanceoleosa]|uniref:AP-2 complex subunit mu n=1 Tax=Camellia lanceoleosa TaxID=1840588 RepID=A0ACC0HFA9_9ERIC|nr:AP-2 complex subunit mu [Camellia lanceoleosa]